MKKKVAVDGAVLAQLRDVFKCSRMGVWKALNFESNSDKARKMRRYALQKGGVLMGINVEPETSYEADGTMIQRFGKRVKLISLRGMVTVYVDEKPVTKTMCREIPEFLRVQDNARQMAIELL